MPDAALTLVLAISMAFASCGTTSNAPNQVLVGYHTYTLRNYTQIQGITTGPDGGIWYTELDAPLVGWIPRHGRLTEFPLLIPTNGREITPGPDGALWFISSGKIVGRITTSGAVTEYTLDVPYSSPQDITAGFDGAVWFTEANDTVLSDGATYRDEIVRLTPAGVFTEFPLPRSSSRTASPLGRIAPCGSPRWAPTRSGA